MRWSQAMHSRINICLLVNDICYFSICVHGNRSVRICLRSYFAHVGGLWSAKPTLRLKKFRTFRERKVTLFSSYVLFFFSLRNRERRKVSTNLGKSSFKFSGSKIWETVPLSLKCVSYNTFKKEWKRQLFINQTWPLLAWVYCWSIVSVGCYLLDHGGSSCYFWTPHTYQP